MLDLIFRNSMTNGLHSQEFHRKCAQTPDPSYFPKCLLLQIFSSNSSITTVLIRMKKNIFPNFSKWIYYTCCSNFTLTFSFCAIVFLQNFVLFRWQYRWNKGSVLYASQSPMQSPIGSSHSFIELVDYFFSQMLFSCR